VGHGQPWETVVCGQTGQTTAQRRKHQFRRLPWPVWMRSRIGSSGHGKSVTRLSQEQWSHLLGPTNSAWKMDGCHKILARPSVHARTPPHGPLHLVHGRQVGQEPAPSLPPNKHHLHGHPPPSAMVVPLPSYPRTLPRVQFLP
jgi:hypothetical protein